MPTTPATNMTMSNKWPYGFDAKREAITRLPTTPGGSLGKLQAWHPSTEDVAVELTALILALRSVTIWRRVLAMVWTVLLCCNHQVSTT